MATPSQIIANRANALKSTGPRTCEGKAAASANARRHGLSAAVFHILPQENVQEFDTLCDEMCREHNPATPTEAFLVRQMVEAEWKLRRIARMEAEILTGEISDTTANFSAGCDSAIRVTTLLRYESLARNAWYRALSQLRALRKDRARTDGRNETNPIPAEPEQTAPSHPEKKSNPTAAQSANEAKPMPEHLRRELHQHKRRDPFFDPHLDFSQMSKALQRYFSAANRVV